MKPARRLTESIQRASSWIYGCSCEHKSVPQARIGIVGEFQPTFEPHAAISAAVDHAQAADPTCPPLALEWIGTSDAEHSSEEQLATYAGWWIAPGSP
jgi:CTP synthase (UTP-ammonia lyase)